MTPEVAGLSGLEPVGRGGFGTVYRARDERFDRTVAVKVLHQASVGPEAAARFDRECRATGLLSSHPNIVAVYDSGRTDDGSMYLVMEYLPGGSLADLLRRGPRPTTEALRVGVDLAGALETAHRAGVIHRDVKPENVLFSEFGVVKLVDFGIARMKSAYETRSGSISATLSHAPPEVIAGAATTAASDVYSLASVLFTMLAGAPPFDRPGEDSLGPLLARITSQAPPDLRQRGIPDPLAAVIEQGLAKDPADRFSSAADFGAALIDAGAQMNASVGPVPLRHIDPLPAIDSDPTANTVSVAAIPGAATPDPTDERALDGSAGGIEAGDPEVGVPNPEAAKRRSRGRYVMLAAAAAVLAIVGAAVFVATRPEPERAVVEVASHATTSTSASASTSTSMGEVTTTSPVAQPLETATSTAVYPTSAPGIAAPTTTNGRTSGTSKKPSVGTTNTTAATKPPVGATGGTTQTTVPPIIVPGSPTNVTVSDPNDTNGAVTVRLTWGAPAAGGAPTHYRIRSQERWRVDCGAQESAAAYEDGGTEPGTSATRSAASPRACSWTVWQVAAVNSAGTSAWVDATGIVPNITGKTWSFHMVRAVGGRASGRPEADCGQPAWTGCSTTVTGRISAGTDVGIISQPGA